jgi:hypothetical protein
MDYFWIIPVGIMVLVAILGFYAVIKRRAGTREDGTILTNDPSEERSV